MNEFDWIVIIVLGFSGLISLMRGFVKEALSLLSWVLAFVVALSFGSKLAYLLSAWFANETLRIIAAFICLFFLTLIVMGVIGSLISGVLAKAGLGFFDRLLGSVFGVLRGALFVLAVLIAIQPFIEVDQLLWWKESKLIPHFLTMEDWAKETFSDINEWRYDVVKKAVGNNS
jgi:membrane protein required for colicin V production